MTDSQNDWLASILASEVFNGNPIFSWKGNNYIMASPSPINEVITAKISFYSTADFKFSVRLNQFANGIIPKMNDYITYKGIKMLIKEIKKPAHDVFAIYSCELPKSR